MIGGSKLAARLEGISRRVATGREVRVGFLEGATYPDGTSVPVVAIVQEFGSGKIPARPYFRPMIAAKKAGWGKSLATVLQNNDFDGEKALEAMGAGIAGQLRQSIIDVTAPPLGASTIRRKGSTKPLVDTGHLLGSVDYEVSS